MKRLFQIFIAFSLILILWFEFRSYQRHRASDAYDVVVDSTIDWSYHNPALVKEYLFAAEEAGQYGRFVWAKEGVDVLTDSPTDPESKAFVQKYQQILSSVSYYHGKLAQSAAWKAEGLSNEQIAQREIGGIPEKSSKLAALLNNPVIARVSDQGALVYEIQKKLVEKGLSIPLDGIYREETRQGVSKFQQAAGLFPSGEVDMLTIERLFQ
ncbi:MAG: peptidoglycan-binding protein [Bacteroidia bacterium]|nr:peptidoglycan-binding protein [Bacteroidia bacterium]